MPKKKTQTTEDKTKGKTTEVKTPPGTKKGIVEEKTQKRPDIADATKERGEPSETAD